MISCVVVHVVGFHYLRKVYTITVSDFFLFAVLANALDALNFGESRNIFT